MLEKDHIQCDWLNELFNNDNDVFASMSFSEEFVLSIFVAFGWLKFVQILFEQLYPGYKLWSEDALSVEDNCVLSWGFCLVILFGYAFITHFCLQKWMKIRELSFVRKKQWKPLQIYFC